MFNKIIDISNSNCFLNVENCLLVITCNNEKTKVPIKEISILLISNSQTTLTNKVITSFSENNASIISCNEKFMPTTMLMPIESNFKQAEKFIKQSQMSLPSKKRIWKEVIIKKVLSQAENLKYFHNNDFGLSPMSERVESGDAKNIESQAARIYWSKLFGKDFTRDRSLEDQNCLLNYGYMVIRAIIARSICSVGLHPTLGVHHHNQYDIFCLADDMMEPFRFIVDRFVVKYTKNNSDYKVDKVFKKEILEHLMSKFKYNNESRTLFDISLLISENLAKVMYDGNEVFKIHDISEA